MQQLEGAAGMASTGGAGGAGNGTARPIGPDNEGRGKYIDRDVGAR